MMNKLEECKKDMKKIFNDINEMKEHYKLLQETLDIFDNRFKRKNPYKMKFRNIETETLYKSKYDYINKVRSLIENSTYKQLKRLNINEILKEIKW